MNSNSNSNEPAPQKPRIHWIWWVISLGLLIWNILIYLPSGTTSISISYSQFMDKVAAGQIASVEISGSSISGKFTSAIPETVFTPGPTSTPSSGTSAKATSYTSFTTVFPDVEGDPNFVATLREHNVSITVAQGTSPLLTYFLSYGLPTLLFLGLMIWIFRRSSMGQSGIMNIGRSKARQYNMDQPKVTFDDVAGVDEAKEELQEVVDFLRRPDKYHKIGARIPRGVLLIGPPGTGKTLMAKAVAGEAGVPFFSISASEFVEMFVGVGASRVRDLFEKAKAASPAIVFIDELDAVGRRRGTGLGNVNDEREQTLNQLLVEMDGFDERKGTILIAATNRPDVLDPALLRPGRFDRQVVVGLPDRKGRLRILEIHSRGLNLSHDTKLDVIARSTTGFSGADLANLCNEAALGAARENHNEITQKDFEVAIDRILLGAKRSLLLNDDQRKTVAYHESGHALVAWLTAAADMVNKVTIIPRGRALGVTEQIPGEDQYNFDKEYLMSRLAVMLGGRVAEEVALKDITTGAENDLSEATRLARRMITRWGMGSLGMMALSTDEEQPFLGYEISQGRQYSEEIAAQIDHDVQNMLNERHNYVKKLIEGSRDKLDLLVKTLLQEETVQQEDLERILGPKLTAPSPANTSGEA